MVERYFPVGKRIQSALSTKKVEINQIVEIKQDLVLMIQFILMIATPLLYHLDGIIDV